LALAGVLFTGDIERAAEDELYPSVTRHPVLKVPHHGSATSSSAPLLDAVDPAIAIVSVGRSNHFGHPNPDVIERYKQRGIAVYRTDIDGTIEVRALPTGVDVRTWRPGRGWSPTARHQWTPTPRRQTPPLAKR
jgi:beta-lactamase superfamily II metal-dependent hydrolase